MACPARSIAALQLKRHLLELATTPRGRDTLRHITYPGRLAGQWSECAGMRRDDSPRSRVSRASHVRLVELWCDVHLSEAPGEPTPS